MADLITAGKYRIQTLLVGTVSFNGFRVADILLDPFNLVLAGFFFIDVIDVA